MRLTGYLTLTIWLAALGGFLAFAYWNAQPGWAELATRLHAGPATENVKTLVAARANLGTVLLSETDRNQLSDGLVSLAATLESYKNKLVSGN